MNGGVRVFLNPLFTITRNDGADAGYSVHSEATLMDPGLVGQR